jgi:hypothetical protein
LSARELSESPALTTEQLPAGARAHSLLGRDRADMSQPMAPLPRLRVRLPACPHVLTLCWSSAEVVLGLGLVAVKAHCEDHLEGRR